MPFTRVSRVILSLAWAMALAAAPGAQAQAGSPAAGVTLVARVSDAAGVRWNTQPANGFLVSSGLITPGDSSQLDAHFVVLQGAWLLGPGHSVSAESRLDAPGEAHLIALQTPGSSAPQAMGFLPATPTAVMLLDRFNPALGQQTVTQGLLVIRPTDGAPEPVLRVSITAL